MYKAKLTFFTLADVPKLRAWENTDYFKEYFRRTPPLTTLSDKTICQMWHIAWIIKVDQETVGLISLGNFDHINKVCEYGILIEPNTANKLKIIIETFKLVADFVFDFINFNKIITRILTGRKNLERVSTLINLKLEGTLKESIFWQGQFYDEQIYGLVAKEHYLINKQILFNKNKYTMRYTL